MDGPKNNVSFLPFLQIFIPKWVGISPPAGCQKQSPPAGQGGFEYIDRAN
jgi:hypothetical protein